MELDKLYTFPELVIGKLEQWSLTRLTGEDRQTYLQGQLTAEIQGLAAGQHTLSGHCDPAGKVWSVLRVINTGKHLWILQTNSAAEKELPELTKYSVFSKITISPVDDYQPIAIIGKHAKTFVEQQWGQSIATQGGLLNNGFCIAYPQQPMRYLFILPTQTANSLSQRDPDCQDIDALWNELNIIAGLPSLTAKTSGQFIPQALNLQLLDAISFTKGCYTGQEVVARAKYRGINKRATLRFVGQSTQPIESGQDIEMQLGDNWRRCGTLLQSFRQENGYTEVLAVVRADSSADCKYRLQNQPDSQLTLAHLPYSLTPVE
ncbi:MAG: tRNA-modifying protein YgfZ [Candidatus Celerinatantimonas neptuna]|nr:MAG: tRNA-modifying protein YgfZ [Candidatus Celerinatantimonas neptuna]